jgi:uncharacterized protein YecE (DUF72 family)
MQLRDKLGPINWQFMQTKKFDPEDFAGFLKLLPKSVEGKAIRHAVEVRHDSFRTADFIALARDYQVAIIVAGDSDYPQIADPTAPFVYARIMGTKEAEPQGCSAEDLDLWAHRAQQWASGDLAEGLDTFGSRLPEAKSRDVFLYVISGFKKMNPAAAMALIDRVGNRP